MEMEVFSYKKLTYTECKYKKKSRIDIWRVQSVCKVLQISRSLNTPNAGYIPVAIYSLSKQNQTFLHYTVLLISVLCFTREQTTQTKEDNYTNVPRPQVFLAGLRVGSMTEPTVMTKMDLTIDVDQT